MGPWARPYMTRDSGPASTMISQATGGQQFPPSQSEPVTQQVQADISQEETDGHRSRELQTGCLSGDGAWR